MSSRAIHKYRSYQKWWDKTEKNFLIITVILFLLLYAAQFSNFIITEQGGTFLSAEVKKLEGIATADNQTMLNTGTIEFTVISNSDYRNIQIYINGDFYSSFSKKTISLTVKNNDIIEISGITSEYPAKIQITSLSTNILDLKLNEIIKVNKNFVKAGRIRLK